MEDKGIVKDIVETLEKYNDVDKVLNKYIRGYNEFYVDFDLGMECFCFTFLNDLKMNITPFYCSVNEMYISYNVCLSNYKETFFNEWYEEFMYGDIYNKIADDLKLTELLDNDFCNELCYFIFYGGFDAINDFYHKGKTASQVFNEKYNK